LNSPSVLKLVVFAPEHARFSPSTPPPMYTSADLESWQPSITSPVSPALL